MGVSIYANGSGKSFDCSYGGFFNLRKNIAFALDKELGEHYAKMMSALVGGGKSDWYNEETRRILASDKFNDENEDVLDFLYASDCEGSISHKTCKKIYGLIKDMDFGGMIFTYAAYSDGKDYERFKEFLLECYKKRRKMRWS